MAFTDSHAHLTSDAIYPQLEAVLDRAKEAGVERIVNICTDPLTLERGLIVSKSHTWVYNVAATTPHDVEKEGEAVFPLIEKHAKLGHLAAIGETGLDYYYQHSPRDLQKYYLKRYLQLALECNLPVVIHCREAFADLFSILDSDYIVDGKHARGILHCFTGTLEEASEVIARGWFLSLSGIVTYKKSDALRSVAKMVPLSQLLIETDSPYLAPQSHRGKTNEPAFVVETAKFIAEIKGISVEELGEATSENASRAFVFNP